MCVCVCVCVCVCLCVCVCKILIPTNNFQTNQALPNSYEILVKHSIIPGIFNSTNLVSNIQNCARENFYNFIFSLFNLHGAIFEIMLCLSYLTQTRGHQLSAPSCRRLLPASTLVQSWMGTGKQFGQWRIVCTRNYVTCQWNSVFIF